MEPMSVDTLKCQQLISDILRCHMNHGIQWIKSHCGIDGNENTNCLTKNCKVYYGEHFWLKFNKRNKQKVWLQTILIYQNGSETLLCLIFEPPLAKTANPSTETQQAFPRVPCVSFVKKLTFFICHAAVHSALDPCGADIGWRDTKYM
ncbi:hypothetical protein TNIN_302211 [Trichonephila inaurata madagascariensis]|uniref:RNase H type-1 domain-containing protein n=1 Tax=Trichonephila inaurata madagascariensis TaxID=2747483 RepID=A0A8X7BWR5_9ARAC|nr:hypothetical protein TNIN_302211 [Trichonephila inaurata madagascariensis]